MEAIINIIIYIVFDESGGGTLSLAGHQGINALFEGFVSNEYESLVE
jgi:hypothetical protein